MKVSKYPASEIVKCSGSNTDLLQTLTYLVHSNLQLIPLQDTAATKARSTTTWFSQTSAGSSMQRSRPLAERQS